jgi:hypothetical protein
MVEEEMELNQGVFFVIKNKHKIDDNLAWLSKELKKSDITFPIALKFGPYIDPMVEDQVSHGYSTDT